MPTLVCQGPSFYLKILDKKGNNYKNIALRVMPLAMQLHLDMIGKYSKFDVVVGVVQELNVNHYPKDIKRYLIL